MQLPEFLHGLQRFLCKKERDSAVRKEAITYGGPLILGWLQEGSSKGAACSHEAPVIRLCS